MRRRRGVIALLALALWLGAGAAHAAPLQQEEPALPPNGPAPGFRLPPWAIPTGPVTPIHPESTFACEPTDPFTTIHSCRKILNFYCEDFVREHHALVSQFLAGMATLDDILAQMDIYDQHGFCEKFFENAAQVVMRELGSRGATRPPGSLPAP